MDWQYIAGFFDGEGNVRCESTSGITVRAIITQCYLPVLVVIEAFLLHHGINCRYYLHKRHSKEHRDAYDLVISAKRENMKKFLHGKFPYLYVKKTEVQDALRAMQLFPVRTGKSGPKPSCRHGHSLSGDNVYIQPSNGSRSCKTCRKLSLREWQLKNLNSFKDTTLHVS